MPEDIKKRLRVLQLQLSLIQDRIDEIKEWIAEGRHIDNCKWFDMMIRNLDFKVDKIRKEVRGYQLIKVGLRGKFN